jgi:hypothetical protein
LLFCCFAAFLLLSDVTHHLEHITSMVFGSDVGVVLRARKGRNLLLQL